MTPNITLRSSSGKPIAELPLSKFATPHTEKEFIHIDRLPDGTWRLLFNVRGPDGKQIISRLVRSTCSTLMAIPL